MSTLMRAVAMLVATVTLAHAAPATEPGWEPSCEILEWKNVTPKMPKGFETKSYLKNHNSKAKTKTLTTRLITPDRFNQGPDWENTAPSIPYQFKRNEYELCHMGINGYMLMIPPQFYKYLNHNQ